LQFLRPVITTRKYDGVMYNLSVVMISGLHMDSQKQPLLYLQLILIFLEKKLE